LNENEHAKVANETLRYFEESHEKLKVKFADGHILNITQGLRIFSIFLNDIVSSLPRMNDICIIMPDIAPTSIINLLNILTKGITKISASEALQEEKDIIAAAEVLKVNIKNLVYYDSEEYKKHATPVDIEQEDGEILVYDSGELDMDQVLSKDALERRLDTELETTDLIHEDICSPECFEFDEGTLENENNNINSEFSDSDALSNKNEVKIASFSKIENSFTKEWKKSFTLNQRMISKQISNNDNNSCELCGKVFYRRKSLSEHMLSHNVELTKDVLLKGSQPFQERKSINDYNPSDFDLGPKNARFFVVKSYSEDDIHRSIKYKIWCSTDHGNKRLDCAFREIEDRGPVYLFFSVNGSGHFCGMAQMLSGVDYQATTSVWAMDKFKGQFQVRWIYVKDVPNSQLRHIRLENNQNKPVTISRDTQEVMPEKGKIVLETIHNYKHYTSILDDFIYYEKRQEEDEIRKLTTKSGKRDRGGPDYQRDDLKYYRHDTRRDNDVTGRKERNGF